MLKTECRMPNRTPNPNDHRLGRGTGYARFLHPSPLPWGERVFSAMVGMVRCAVRCAVPARAVAGGTDTRGTLAFEGVAPLHAARTSQRDVPTMLNTYWGEGEWSTVSRSSVPEFAQQPPAKHQYSPTVPSP